MNENTESSKIAPQQNDMDYEHMSNFPWLVMSDVTSGGGPLSLVLLKFVEAAMYSLVIFAMRGHIHRNRQKYSVADNTINKIHASCATKWACSHSPITVVTLGHCIYLNI